MRVLVDRGVKRGEISLAFGFYQNGVLVPPPAGGKTDDDSSLVYTAARWQNPTAEDRGARARLQWLMEAVCRFVNTGGSWIDVENIPLLAKIFSGSFSPDFDGHRLIGTFVDPDGDIEHLFARPNAKNGVSWVEGVTVMEVDLADRLDQIIHDD